MIVNQMIYKSHRLNEIDYIENIAISWIIFYIVNSFRYSPAYLIEMKYLNIISCPQMS